MMDDLPPEGVGTSTIVALLTLADLSAALPAAGLSPKRLADLQSSIRTISRIAGRNPEHVPLALPTLRRILEHVVAGTRGLSKKTAQNLRSNLCAAIEASGLKRLLRT